MVDREINEFENAESVENALRSLEPQPLGIDSGKVMFEAGRAVGREQALSESQSRVHRSLIIWRLATAASFAVALFSLIGQLNPPMEKTESIVDKKVVQPETLNDSQKQQTDQVSTHPSTSVAYSPSPFWNTRSADENDTVIGIRNQLLKSAFEPNAEFSLPTEKLVFEQPKTALQLLRQYTNSEEL